MSDVAAAIVSRNGTPAGPLEGLLGIDDMDKRTRGYRRAIAVREAIYSDLGGEALLSEIQRQLVVRFTTMTLTLEAMDAAALAGEEVDADMYGRLVGHMNRVGKTLGLKRQPRDIGSGSTLDDDDKLRRIIEGA